MVAWCVAVLSLCCFCFGEDCSSLQDLLHEEEASFFVFDLDNTLIRPVRALGSDEWFRSYYAGEVARGGDARYTLEKVVALWKALQTLTPVKTLEATTAETIRELQKKHKVIVLTTRSPDFCFVSHKQLRSVGIDIAGNVPARGTFSLDAMPLASYADGILFANNQNKGDVLLSFFRQIGYTPRRVVFIDDHSKYVRELAAVEAEGIAYRGVRYSAADSYVGSLNEKECDEELKKLLALFKAA